MDEDIEVTPAQFEACLSLFKAVTQAIDDATAQRSSMCVDVDVWALLLNAHDEVRRHFGW